MSALAAVMAVVSLASVPAGGQVPAAAATAQSAAATPWTPPRTPWGEPDLQGVWRDEGETPLERPKEFGAREFLTDDELAQRVQKEKAILAAKIAGETNGPAVGRRPVEESPIAGNEYNAFWQETFREKTGETNVEDCGAGGADPLYGGDAEAKRRPSRDWGGTLPDAVLSPIVAGV